MNKRTFVLVISLIVFAMPLARSAGARVGLPATQGSSGQPLEATPPAPEVDLAPADAEAALALATTRVSVSSAGVEGNNESNYPALSNDGRYVAFESLAANLVPNDNNAEWDVFIHDRQTGQTQRVSVNSSGQEGNGKSWAPAISSTGRYVAFSSFASNLVSGDTNNGSDIFVIDRDTGVLQRVSVSSSETQTSGGSHDPAISDNGRYIAFYSGAGDLVASDTNGKFDVFVRDTVAGDTWRVSISTGGAQGNDNSWGNVSISGDGRRVAFASWANTLVPNDTNGAMDAFVRDWFSGWTAIVSVSTGGAMGNNNSSGTISDNGRYVAFGSDASNLVGGDTNGTSDAFVHDLDTGLTERVSVSSDGQQSNGSVYGIEISSGGRLVIFHSSANNLVSNDTNSRQDVFVHDREYDRTSRVSIATNGTQGNANSLYLLAMSGDTRFVAFSSYASNLVANDNNGVLDVFVREFRSCYALALQKQSGEGAAPVATPARSIGCEPGTYQPGEAITVTADPADGWHVSGWNGTNDDGSTAATNAITMPNNDHTIAVSYAADCYTLTLGVFPNNSGNITYDPQNSASCPPNGQYTAGASVSLLATANSGYQFSSWSGDVSGTQNPRSLTMDGNKSVTANFSADCYTLTRNAQPGGSGSITPDPPKSAACPANDQYTYGAVVSLTATANTGYSFLNWSGALSGSQTTRSLTMDGNKSVTANFSTLCYTLNLNTQPSGSGNITPSPLKSASCPSNYQYTANTSVSLQAVPNSGYQFNSWSGALSGANNPTSLFMDGNKSVTANFVAACYTLTLNRLPSSGGSITANPSKSASCPTIYQYTAGTNVSLTAVPTTGYEFDGWGGALTGTQNPQSVVINDNRSVTARFSDSNEGCFLLILEHTGNGSDPTTSPSQSPGCSASFYRSGAVIQLTADPANGWRVVGWSGTDNDSRTSTANTVTMPAAEHTVSVVYAQNSPTARRAFLPSVVDVPLTCWPGPEESAQNDDMILATGPLCSGRVYSAHDDDKFDYYFLDAAAGEIAIDMTDHTYPKVQILLYYQRASGVPVDNDTSPEGGWNIRYNGPAGRYYVIVYSDADSFSTRVYTLQASFPTTD